MTRYPSLVAAAFTAAIFFAPAAASGPIPEVTAAVDDVIERYGLPGIAVGLVVDGQVRQIEVRGETAAGSGDPVRSDTLFKVASNTKAMTAALGGRGGGKPEYQQGSVKADKAAIEAFFKENGV